MGGRILGDRLGPRAGDKVIVDGVMKIGPGAPVRIAAAGQAGRRQAARAGRGEEAPVAPDKGTANEIGQTSAPMFSRFFIDRPIFAAVLSIFIVIAGLAAIRVLPVGQYPEIAPPVVTVRAVYPGASATTLEQTVAAPLENAINGVEDMLYMSSTSASNGAVEMQVTFNIGADVDKAALNVNNRVKQAEARLPLEVRRQGVTVEKGSSAFLQVIAFSSPDSRYDGLFISNYVTLNVLDQLKRIPGTTNVQIFGAKDYAMRIWLKPDRLSQLKLTTAEVTRAITEQNAQFAAGRIGQAPTSGTQELVYTVTTKGRLAEVAEFENIVVRANPDGSNLRLKDVARVELGSKDYEFIGRVNGREATLVGIFLQPGANALAVAQNVNQTWSPTSPAGSPTASATLIVYDTTRFVKVSIREVVITLAEAMLLVLARRLPLPAERRATLIPMLAVPVSLIGTFAGLLALGYSINTLTLFGMVLAIGIVVDDAIVVLENVERIMHEMHLSARESAIKAMQEVTGPVIAIVLVLCAVFVPIAFLGGLTGELYRQFAVTLSIAVVISGIVALTLTPALCVLILKRGRLKPNPFFRWFNDWFARVTGRYARGVDLDDPALGGRGGALPRHGGGHGRALAGHAGVARARRGPGLLHRRRHPARRRHARAHRPGRERGGRHHQVEPVQRERDRVHRLRLPRRRRSATARRRSSSPRRTGTSGRCRSRRWSASCAAKTGHIKEALVLAFTPPPIFGLGNAGGFEFYIQNRGEGGAQRLSEVAQKFIGTASARTRRSRRSTRSGAPTRRSSTSTWTASGPRRSACRSTTCTTPSPRRSARYYVNDFNSYGRTWQVLMSSESRFRKRPDDIGAGLDAERQGRHGPALGARRHPLRVGSRDARPLQQPAGGEDPRRRARRERARARRSPRSRRSRKRCCPPTSRSTGAARRTRRRRPAAPRCWRSGWRR